MSNPFQAQIDELNRQIAENEILLTDPELKTLAQAEIAKLAEQKQILDDAAAQLNSSSQAELGPDARHHHAILEFRQGAGGDEAKLWAEELMRMYIRFAELLKLKVEFIDESVIKIKGMASLPDLPHQLTAYELLQYESGVHRVQRVPVTESQGRIHTSTATVAVLPEVHPAAVQVNDEDLEWQFIRSSGAGGQSVNKTSSAVRLTHVPSGIMVSARQERKQTQNREIALELLRSQLWEIEEEKRLQKIGQARASIGRARRSEKIRTYNFPQSRVTDHRIKESWHNLDEILQGNLTDVVSQTYQLLQDAEKQAENQAEKETEKES